MEDLDPTLMARIEKEGVGPFLRHLREEKEVSLRSLSEHTRIRTYYLESIERGDFDKLPTGPVGLGFVRAFADAVGADSKAVAASYKRETASGVPLEEYGLESETRILFSSPPRTNRFSSVATFVFVLVFLLAGGGILWFMKGRTEQLVPVGSLVDRIKTAVAPVAERLPGVNEKVKGENGVGRETAALDKKAPEQERSAVAAVNLREPPVADKEEEPSPAVEKPSAQDGTPVQENPVAEKIPLDRENSPAQTQESPPVQASVQSRETPPVRENPSPPENSPVSGNPPAQANTPASPNDSIPADAPAEEKVALNTTPRPQTTPREGQPPVPPAPATPGELPLTLRIFAAEDTWLRIVVDAEKTEELLLLAGNEKDWKASEKFTLTVGNVAGTQVSLNGAEIALPRNSSNVLRDFVIPGKSLN